MAFKIIDYRVTVRLTAFIVNRSNLDNLLGRFLDPHRTGSFDTVESGLVLETYKTRQSECQSRVQQIKSIVKWMEPFFRTQDSYVFRRREPDLDWDFIGLLERVSEILEFATIQELRLDLHDSLSIASNFPLYLDQLARVIVDNGCDLSRRFDHIPGPQRSSAGDHAETVGQMDEFEKISID